MKWFRNAALVALLCLSLMGSALATEPAADASMGSEIPVTEDVSSPEESSVEETSGEETADAEESTDTEESIDTGLTDEDISWLMESSDSVTMGYSTYSVDDSEVSYEENTMGDVIVSIFGVYQPKTQTVTDHLSDGTSVTYEQIVPGVAGMDWNWIAGVALFALVLYSFLKMVGVFLKHD